MIPCQCGWPLLAMATDDDITGQEGPMTEISISDTQWRLDGSITYPGAVAEGLLMNVRMVNATFEDRNRDDFDPDTNTDVFIEARVAS